MGQSVVTETTWRALLERDDYGCLSCNSTLGLQPAHYRARSLLGNEVLDNLMLLCGECHRAQHDNLLIVKRINRHFFFKDKRKWRISSSGREF